MLTDGRTDGQKNMFFLYYIDVTFGKGVTGDMQACAQGFFRLSSLKKPLSGFKSKRPAVDWINKFFVCNQVASKCSAHTLIDRVWIVKSVAS